MTRSFLAFASLLTGLFTAPTFAGQAPGAAADPDIPISHRDRVHWPGHLFRAAFPPTAPVAQRRPLVRGLVAGREGPAKPLDLALPGRVHGCLQFKVEGASADPAAVHWTENLDIADRVEPEGPRYSCLHQFDDARHGDLRLLTGG